MSKHAGGWHQRAEGLDIRKRGFIGGRHVNALSGETFECINPATTKSLGSIASMDVADVDLAVAAAREAFEAGVWSRMAPSDRKRRMLKLAELIDQNRDELALLEALDTGKPISDALTGDIPSSSNCIRWFAESIDKLYDEIAPTAPTDMALMRREPLGVVAAVVPWNFPLLMAAWKIGPVLATGNSIIVKPAEQSPLTMLRIAEMAAEAGIPDGVFNVVPGYGEKAGQALGLHMDVDAVTFTGSTEVGKYFLKYSGNSNMKRISLECGGKSPQVVLADTPDLDAAASAVAWGIFYNQGESCNAGSRLVIEKSIKDDFLDKVISISKGIRVGDPLDPETQMGALVDETQMKRVLGYIESGVSEGAKVVLGGGRIKDHEGYFVEPTVFDEVDNKMKIAREEIFGPVIASITVNDVEEAVRVANDTSYGLAASVWTKDITQAFQVSRRLKAGVVWVNCFDRGDISAPFGGFKESGFGRDKSLHAMDKYTDIKTTWVYVG